jgi:putative ABC transport system permease protein
LAVSPGYFRTLGAAVRSGREFDDTDGSTTLRVAVVNELFANREWPGENPLGRRLRLFDGTTPGEWLTVVGVVSNIVQTDATRQSPDPLVYVPHRQASRAGLWVLARTRVPPMALADDFRAALQALDQDLPVMLGPYPLEQRMAEAYWNAELYALLFLIFAAIALLLAAVGLYATVAYAVSRHTQEIGIRMAVGASGRHILALVFRLGMLPLAVGLALGLAATLGLTRVLESMLVHVSPHDPVAYGVTIVVLGVSAGLGCVIPARRALRVDPVVALRPQ